MPAEVSGHPVLAFETLDSRIFIAVVIRLDLWRENDRTRDDGPQVHFQEQTSSDCF